MLTLNLEDFGLKITKDNIVKAYGWTHNEYNEPIWYPGIDVKVEKGTKIIAPKKGQVQRIYYVRKKDLRAMYYFNYQLGKRKYFRLKATFGYLEDVLVSDDVEQGTELAITSDILYISIAIWTKEGWFCLNPFEIFGL